MEDTGLVEQYRPRRFADVIGQDVAVNALRNAITEGRMGRRAYLLFGPTGTGKTTLAGLVARAANCAALDDGEPCGGCKACKAELGPECGLHVVKKHGVDDIRKLYDEAKRLSLYARHKVYLLDEAHRLTADAQDVMLGLLEALPSHVTFVLTTDQPDALARPLRDRCTRLQLRRVTTRVLATYLRQMPEGRVLSDRNIERIAQAAGGSVRDGVQKLGTALDALTATISEDDEQAAVGLAIAGAAPVRRTTTPRRRGTQGGVKGRPVKEDERRQVILKMVASGDWVAWAAVLAAGRRAGLLAAESMRKTRRLLVAEGLIEWEKRGNDGWVRKTRNTGAKNPQ